MNLAFAIAVSTGCARAFAPSGLRVGALRDGEVFGRLAEVTLACCLHAIGAGAEIDAVEIELENLGLGVLALQPERQLSFLQFALEGAFLGQEQVFRQLLGKRRATLRNAAMQDVGNRRPQNAPGVDAEMRIEAAVLDGDERLRQIR